MLMVLDESDDYAHAVSAPMTEIIDEYLQNVFGSDSPCLIDVAVGHNCLSHINVNRLLQIAQRQSL